MADQKVSIVPLREPVWPALEALFREGGDPRWCWCMYWRLGSKEFSGRRVPELRDELHDLANRPIAPGLVAIDGERAVGWVGLGPREEFDRLTRSRTIPRLDGEAVWSIVCFAVSRTNRGRGIGGALLEAAISYAVDNGARVLEAYPVDVAGAIDLPAASAFTGTRSMFERAGFRAVGDTSSRVGACRRVLVRSTPPDRRAARRPGAASGAPAHRSG